MDVAALLDYINTFTKRSGNCIKILDRVLPNMESMYKDELKHIRDELSQITQMGILIRDQHGKEKNP